MRARNIKPSFFKNPELCQVSEATRLLFIGLWCMADRKGRLEDRPAKIKIEIFPCDQHDVSTMLDQLQHHGFLLRYEANNNRYIQIINFEKHQFPHVREQASTIPAPGKHQACTGQARLNPDVLNPDVLNPESPLPAAPGKSGAAEVSFEALWANYPKRRGKKTAERHFKASVKTPEDWQAIQKALSIYRKEIVGKDLQYVKNGDTWFNNWRDYLEALNGQADDGRASPDYYANLAKRAREAAGLRETSVRDDRKIPHSV